jgi:hypothetical protein
VKTRVFVKPHPYTKKGVIEATVDLIGFIPISGNPSIRAIAYLKLSAGDCPVGLYVYVVDRDCQIVRVNQDRALLKKRSNLFCAIEQLIRNAQKKWGDHGAEQAA